MNSILPDRNLISGSCAWGYWVTVDRFNIWMVKRWEKCSFSEQWHLDQVLDKEWILPCVFAPYMLKPSKKGSYFCNRYQSCQLKKKGWIWSCHGSQPRDGSVLRRVGWCSLWWPFSQILGIGWLMRMFHHCCSSAERKWIEDNQLGLHYIALHVALEHYLKSVEVNPSSK